MKKFISAVLLSSVILSFCGAQAFNAGTLKKIQAPVEPMRYSRSLSEAVTETFFDIFLDLWLLDTIFITFDDYPYCNGDYMKFGSKDTVIEEILPDGSDGTKPRAEQFYRFALDTSLFFFPGRMVGNETRFEGLLWKFFGPLFQIDASVPLRSFDGNEPFKSVNTNLQLGFQLSIIQTNPVSLYWALCWQRIQYQDMPLSNGISLQLIARSYPASPILLEWRGTIGFMAKDGGAEYSPDFNWESHLEVGMMINGPLEVFAAWRYFAYLALGTPVHGVEIGARYHL